MIRRSLLASLLLLAPVPRLEAAAPPREVPETRLAVPGLARAVEVRLDRWGVPHIYAQSQDDLFFAQGFVAARDRLFQMEMWRRLGEGRLAEVLGSEAVERDRLSRLFRYRGDLRREWAAYGKDTREIATAFVAGVNAWIARTGDDLPPEFGLLGFRPEPWAPEVVLSRTTTLSGVSNGSLEVVRALLVQNLGAERVERLLPSDPPRPLDPAPGLDLEGIDFSSLGGAAGAFADLAFPGLEGSNNWVVDGRKSATGKPILANDPHRALTHPAVRYLTHLVAPGWNVIGAGEPASPGVSIGHNDRIAFGLTVVGMDQQDVYVEELGPCGPTPAEPLGCYRYERRWRPLETVVETIRVKGEAPREVRLQFTVHGPVVSIDAARKRAFVLKSIHQEPGTAPYLASLALGRARTWRQFEAAMARWLHPTENMLYADVDGNIGWIAAGLMPRRSWSGRLPVPGDGSHEWRGFVPARKLPRAKNPRTGFLATANHNILPPGYPIPLSFEWAPRYRVDRIEEILRQERRFGVEDFAELQRDVFSKAAAGLVPRLLAAARRTGHAVEGDLATLVAWDFRMTRDQVAPTLFAAWAPAAYRQALRRELADQPDTAALFGYPDLEWLESHLTGLERQGAEAAGDTLVLEALAEAVAQLETRFGTDRTRWLWGEIHTATFRHPFAPRYDLPPVARGGDANTLNATGGRDFRQTTGASFRLIVDLADFDRSLAINVPGQSGDPRSPHYANLLPLWAEDGYFPLVYSRKRVEEETAGVLWLEPARK